MENEIVDIDTQNDGGASDTETTDNGEGEAGDGVTKADDLETLKEQNKQLFARAKKAEGFEFKDGKWVKKPKPAEPAINKSNETVGLTREEAILIAKGTDERIINEASVIAKAKGISISEAIKDPLIEAYSDKLKADEKKRKSQLGASGGSSSSKTGDLTQRVGMTEEEHKKAIGM